MKSITLHNLDDELQHKLEQLAQAKGTSLNKTIKELLRDALKITQNANHREDFSEFLGIWNEADHREFSENLKKTGVEDIDPEDWK